MATSKQRAIYTYHPEQRGYKSLNAQGRAGRHTGRVRHRIAILNGHDSLSTRSAISRTVSFLPNDSFSRRLSFFFASCRSLVYLRLMLTKWSSLSRQWCDSRCWKDTSSSQASVDIFRMPRTDFISINTAPIAMCSCATKDQQRQQNRSNFFVDRS